MQILPEIGLTQETKEFIDGFLLLIEQSLSDCDIAYERFASALAPVIEAEQMVREANSEAETDIDVDFKLITARKEHKNDVVNLRACLSLAQWLLKILDLTSLMVLGRSRECEDKVSELGERLVKTISNLENFVVSGQNEIDGMNYETLINNSTSKTWNPLI